MKTYTIEEAKKMTKTGIQIYLKKDMEGNYQMQEVNRLPFYWVGAPGIGKTQAARQIAEELQIGFVSQSLTHHSRTTVMGLPTIQQFEKGGTQYTEYTMSEIIAAVEEQVQHGKKEGVLLIDEFANMPESMVPPMLAFLQTKNIGRYVLPEGWVMILCSNPKKYNHSVRDFDMAVMDRVRLMKIGYSIKEFVNYGEKKGMHPSILEFLSMHPENLHICENDANGNTQIVTPRGWENLSWAIAGEEELGGEVSCDLIGQFVKDEKVSFEFWQFYDSRRKGMETDWLTDVLAGKNLEKAAGFYQNKSYQEKYQFALMLEKSLEEQVLQYDASEDMEKLVKETLEHTAKDDALTELRGHINDIGTQAGNLCIFMEKANFEHTLQEMILHKLQKSKCFVDCMLVAENRDYLDHLRRLTGTEEVDKGDRMCG